MGYSWENIIDLSIGKNKHLLILWSGLSEEISQAVFILVPTGLDMGAPYGIWLLYINSFGVDASSASGIWSPFRFFLAIQCNQWQHLLSPIETTRGMQCWWWKTLCHKSADSIYGSHQTAGPSETEASGHWWVALTVLGLLGLELGSRLVLSRFIVVLATCDYLTLN